MTRKEALDLAQAFKGLLPCMTHEQFEYVADVLERVPAKAGKDAVDRYVVANEDFSVSRFSTELRRAGMRRGTGLDAGPPAYPGSAEQLEAVEAYIRSLSDEEIEEAKERALAEAAEFVRAHYARANPKTSAVLKSLIYERRELSDSIEPLTQQGAS